MADQTIIVHGVRGSDTPIDLNTTNAVRLGGLVCCDASYPKTNKFLFCHGRVRTLPLRHLAFFNHTQLTSGLLDIREKAFHVREIVSRKLLMRISTITSRGAMNIRPYDRADLGACEGIFNGNIPIYFAEEERSAFIEFLTNPPGPYLAIEEGGQVIACGGWANSKTTPGEIILCWGMVKQDRHREGIGARLMEARLTRIFKNNPSTVVSLSTSQHSAGFFATFGFQTVRRQKDGHAPSIDLVEMKLNAAPFQ